MIFDEFHERSLNAGLGLALTYERDRRCARIMAVLVMSATLNAEPVARFLDAAPMIRSEGRLPVDTRWLDRPLPAGSRLIYEAARLIAQAEAETRDAAAPSWLFCRRGRDHAIAAALRRCDLVPLRGAADFKARRAMRPAGGGGSCWRPRSRKPR
ncbi:MAG: hypothetical protein U1E55_05445 [Paracoccus sp. (in: a-proteobacteria)]